MISEPEGEAIIMVVQLPFPKIVKLLALRGVAIRH
jgi:hypothetical protein